MVAASDFYSRNPLISLMRDKIILQLQLIMPGSVSMTKDVAKRQDISDKYLEQIISILNKAGYVRSVRGAQGGYMLKMEPQNYTVGMILRQTEGSLAPVACIEDDEIVCDRQQQCVTSIVYKKINDAISGVVDNITLQDLVDWQDQTKTKGIRPKTL